MRKFYLYFFEYLHDIPSQHGCIGFLSIVKQQKLRISKPIELNSLRDMIESPVPKRLKEARLRSGFSQKKLGIAAGMDQFSASARMNHYEIGRHTPDYSTLKRVALILELPVAYFYAESDELAQLIKIVGKLTKNEQIIMIKRLSEKE